MLESSDNRIRLGFIGCGKIFDKHIKSFSNLSDTYKLVCICSHNVERVDSLTKDLGVKGYTDHHKMLEEMKGKVDMIVILTQSAYHHELALEVLRSSFNVLIEKPVSSKVSEIREIQEEANRLGLKAYTVLQLRYSPTYILLNELKEKNILGDVRAINVIQRWQRPIGYINEKNAPLLNEYGIHVLDIIQNVYGIPRVRASSEFKHKHMDAPYGDTIYSILAFANGASGSIEVNLACEPSNIETSISIIGSKGFVKLGFPNGILDAHFEREEDEELFKNIFSNLPNDVEMFYEVYKDIARKNGLEVEESIPVTEFIQKIYEKES